MVMMVYAGVDSYFVQPAMLFRRGDVVVDWMREDGVLVLGRGVSLVWFCVAHE